MEVIEVKEVKEVKEVVEVKDEALGDLMSLARGT